MTRLRSAATYQRDRIMTQSEFSEACKKLAEFQAETDFADKLERLSKFSKKGYGGKFLLPARLEIRVVSAESRDKNVTHDEKIVIDLRTNPAGEPQDTGNDEASLSLLRIVNAIRLLAVVAHQESLERLDAFQLPQPVAEALISPCSDVPA